VKMKKKKRDTVEMNWIEKAEQETSESVGNG
jgi:hypothetical protein